MAYKRRSRESRLKGGTASIGDELVPSIATPATRASGGSSWAFNWDTRDADIEYSRDYKSHDAMKEVTISGGNDSQFESANVLEI